MAQRQSRLPSILAALTTLPVVVFGVGFVLHTDYDAHVFGKYSWGYAAFLLGWWLLLAPLTFFFVRFVLRTQRMELSASRVWHVRPSLKLLLCVLLCWGIAGVVDHQVHRRSGRGVATPMQSDEFHPYLQNTMRAGKRRFGTNRWGFRGTDIERAKPPGVVRIFTLGGSTTVSMPLPLTQTYPELLAAKLREAHPEVTLEIQNAAGEWHTTQHSVFKLLGDIRDFAPDLILCYHAINDLGRSLSPDMFAVGDYRADYRHFLGPVSALARPRESRWPIVRIRLGYCFSDLLMDRVRILGPEGKGVQGMTMAFLPKAKEIEIESWQSLVAFRRNLGDLCEICSDAGIDLVLATQPSLYRDDLSEYERSVLWTPITHQSDGKCPSIASMIRGMEQFNTATADVAMARGVGLVDLAAVVPKTLDYLYDDVHYTPKACRLISDAFYEHLEGAETIASRVREYDDR